ncbi:V-type ATP synthase subunit E [Aerococcus suis]|uniref:H+-ATPase subunit E/Vma4 n=1 Tax=Aerococcus suis TaxID=371602 RepID=A0A1W1Y1L4_9LACT|nr:V-type ATP synthase subunit E [Aerococcus suis]SMC30079.1 H+-ATPase subunit E/Vma4 [Aerococcus suis]
MELNEKMTFFDEQVMKEANANIDQQLEQYRETLEKDYEDYSRKLEASVTDRLDNEKTAIHKQNNKEISQTQIKQQRDLYVEEEKLKKSLFNYFKDEMNQYMQTSEYIEQLQAMIHSVEEFADDEDFIVYLNETDKDKLPQLTINNHGELKVSDRDFIGGARGVLTKRNILVDYSFSTLLANEEDNFVLKEVDAGDR